MLKAVSNTGGGSGGAFLPSLSYDMPAFRRALAGTQGNVAPTKILFLGESHIAGEGAGTSTKGLVGAFPLSMAQASAKVLSSLYGSVSTDAFLGDQNLAVAGLAGGLTAGYATYDARIAQGSGWTEDAGGSIFGGRFFTAPGGSTGKLTFTPATAFDTVVVYYPVSNGSNGLTLSSVLTVDVGGTTIGTINQQAVPTYTSVTFTKTLGTGVIGFTNGDASHGAFVAGCYAYNSAAPRPIVIQAGWLGATISNIVNIGSFAWNGVSINFSTLAPDLTIIEEVVNDENAATSPASYQANLTTLCTAAKLTGDVLILTGWPSGSANATNGVLDGLVAASKAVGVALGINVIDVRQWFGANHTISTTYGLNYAGDTDHPNAKGHALYAEIVYSALKQIV